MQTLYSFFLALKANEITVFFIIVMLVLAIMEFISLLKNKHIDFKSIIISIGILGTFVGIFIGLLKFNTISIKESIPTLLEGLKTAFLTSIIGMFLSIVLSIIEKFKGEGISEEEISILKNIDKKLEQLKNLEILNLVNTKLDSIDSSIKILSSDISSVKEELKHNQSSLFDFLEESLNKINLSLDEAIDKLAEGATEEIIKALENVIKDFNKNLTEQFGDNFKQLNESVKNMIIWQENYKNSINELEKAFKLSINSISETNKKLSEMTENYKKIDQTHNNLKDIIQTNENQINNIEMHLKSLQNIGIKAKLMLDSIDTFSEKIKNLLSNQSETLNQLLKDGDKLKKDIEKQLPESLGELNKALTSLTNKFRDDYNSFLQHMSKIMELSNKI